MRHPDNDPAGLCTHISEFGDLFAAFPAVHVCSTVPDVVRACLTALPGIGGGAVVMLAGSDVRQTIHASNEIIAAVEDVEFLHGEGPCFYAFVSGLPMLVGSLDTFANRLRWPMYAPAVTALGVSAMFALPIELGGVTLGVLELYRTTGGPLPAGQATTAAGYATAAAYALLNTAALSAEPGIDNAAGHRDAVHQATGFIAVQLPTSMHTALLRLRAHAYATTRCLDDVCQDVVARRLSLTV